MKCKWFKRQLAVFPPQKKFSSLTRTLSSAITPKHAIIILISKKIMKVVSLFLYIILFMNTYSFAQALNPALFKNLGGIQLIRFTESSDGFFYFGQQHQVLFSSKNSDIPPKPYYFGTKETSERVLSNFHYGDYSFVSTYENTYLITNSERIQTLNLSLKSNLSSINLYEASPEKSQVDSIYEYYEGFFLLAKEGVYHFNKKNAKLDKYYLSESALSFKVVPETRYSRTWQRIEIYEKDKVHIYMHDKNLKITLKNTGDIKEFIHTNNYAWIISDKAITIWSFKLGAITFQGKSNEYPYNYFSETVDYIWSRSPRGNLYRFEKSNGSDPLELNIRFTPFNVIESGDEVFVLNPPHVYRLANKGAGDPKHLSSKLGESSAFVIEGKSGTWFVAETGIYLWKASSPDRLENHYPIPIEKRFTIDGVYGSITENGLFILSSGSDPYYIEGDDFHKVGDGFLDEAILLKQGEQLLLWELKQPNNLTKLDIPFKEGANVDLDYTEKSYILNVEDEIYVLSKKTGDITKSDEYSDNHVLNKKNNTKRLHGDLWIKLEHNSQLVIQVKNLNKQKTWDAKIIPESSIPKDISLNQEISLSWSIDDYHGQSDPELIHYSAILTNLTVSDLNSADKIEYTFANNDIARISGKRFRISLPPLDSKGNYRLDISAQDLFGNTIPYTRTFWAGRTQAELITELLKNIVSALLIINIFSFIFLVIGARWYSLCFEILTDPVFRKLGVYFGGRSKIFSSSSSLDI